MLCGHVQYAQLQSDLLQTSLLALLYKVCCCVLHLPSYLEDLKRFMVVHPGVIEDEIQISLQSHTI